MLVLASELSVYQYEDPPLVTVTDGRPPLAPSEYADGWKLREKISADEGYYCAFVGAFRLSETNSPPYTTTILLKVGELNGRQTMTEKLTPRRP
jgi:hypothetical protein